ncbi:LysR family transcriptional regulator [Nitratireductor pacificus]|uniref:LysR family transcriptional regulator n=1 Tax=Nitratireductor pacificus pht-3B TaxID=391937 RepID=K2MLS3_9HYPH|nr:LysR family transcriptional regulator [Nitratireductor pacificus]EKF18162.1 LysR family transcriptional regulator [Nitratireductor pacificus pht-3B]
MDRLHEIEVFIAVAEAGSFARAGRQLRLSPPAVTRAIAALEERLGARVFNRTTRSLSITDVGQRFLEAGRRLVTDLDTAEKEAVGETASPQGHLNVTASVTFGRSALPPVVCSFLSRYPRVTASVLLLDRVVNLIEEGIDVAVRIGHLPDSNLIAKRIGSVRRMLVASPDYLARRGMPETPADLRFHAILAFTGLMPNREWRFQNGQKPGSVALRPTFEINDAVAAIQAAEMGNGITIALSYMVSDQIRAGKLVPVLDPFTPSAVPVHLVYPHARLVAPKTRAFIDHAAPRLRSALDRLAT